MRSSTGASISYIHHTTSYKQYCHVGNQAAYCKLGSLQDADYARNLTDSKSTSSVVLCFLGSHMFVPLSCACKKQTAVSHSRTEAEMLSLDAGLRMEGFPAVKLWDTIIDTMHPLSGGDSKSVSLHRLARSKNQFIARD